MSTCVHINSISLKWNHSVLNPQKWLCRICGTTESVWACLICENVACGRYSEQHALQHYQESKHKLAVEINEKYVYCYHCEDYVINDNAASDLKILRESLSAVVSQSSSVGLGTQRLLRSRSYCAFERRPDEESRLTLEDQEFTANLFNRFYCLLKNFHAWRECVVKEKHSDQKRFVLAKTKSRRKALYPGITGLRNLGNTCYMNSILQVLSHMTELRDFFLKELPHKNRHKLQKQTTVEVFQTLSESTVPNVRRRGLSGGSGSMNSCKKSKGKSFEYGHSTLTEELQAVLRVLWSGKWALVSPHKMLSSVWSIIPFFRGFAQQDAQEFLCELLDKIRCELSMGESDLVTNGDIVKNLFEGELSSTVTCLKCKSISVSREAFMDLSLEFPQYCHSNVNRKNTQLSCNLSEMIGMFTSVEKLDGAIYLCDKCNRKRRSKSESVYTEAQKRIGITHLPQILRLHLKRFVWCGRNNRGKISCHVAFPLHIDMANYLSSTPNHHPVSGKPHWYQLRGIVMHHGRGFGCGHYTAYCWNDEAKSWVHCNDARLKPVSEAEVLSSQAYILIYTLMHKAPIEAVSLSDISISAKMRLQAFKNRKRKSSECSRTQKLKRRRTTSC